MAEYQQIEYRIQPDGKVVETVIGGSGETCTTATAGIEQALGTIVGDREYLPEYYAAEAALHQHPVTQNQTPS
jgi:Protein of unknown function (DUF2997)